MTLLSRRSGPAVPYERRLAGPRSIPARELSAEDAFRVKEELVATFERKQYKAPALPVVAIDLMELSQKSEAGVGEVVAYIEQDPMIAVRVLRLAQSPAFATRVACRSIADAVHRLGLVTLRDLVWQAALEMRVFRVPGYAHVSERLRRHSVATARVARMISAHTAIPTEYAFLCGLLHDVGVTAILLALVESSPADPPVLDLLWPTIDQIHAEASGHLATRWGLSPELGAALACHHRFDVLEQRDPLVATVCMAEALAQAHGFGIVDGDELGVPPAFDAQSEVQQDTASEILGLSVVKRRALEREVAAVVHELA